MAHQQQQNFAAPIFTPADLSAQAQQAVASRGNPASFNLEDIFGDVAFTPNGETVFLDETGQQQQQQQQPDLLRSGEGAHVAPLASRPTLDGNFAPIPQGGGLYTTQLYDPSKQALQMGAAAPGVKPTAPVPFRAPVQKVNHLQFATASKKRKATPVGRPSDRKMSEQQKIERRYVDLCNICSLFPC